MRTRRSAWLPALLTVGALLWVTMLVVAPAWRAAPRAAAGRPATAGAPGPATGARALVAGLVDLVGARVCHRRPERSFHLHGQPMPVCGRCVGLYVSAAVGLVAAGVLRTSRVTRQTSDVRPSSWLPTLDPRAGWLAAAAMPTILTWTLEVAGLWNPGTPLRALAALPLGATAGWLLGRSTR